MKELVTSWIILIVLIALFCFNSYAINGLTKSISDEIEIVKSSIEDDDAHKAEALFIKYNQSWKKKTKKLLYIYHHRQLEEINKMIHIAGEYISKKELENAYIRLSEAQYLLKVLRDDEKITLDNIF